jgi:signal recognition particle receptor subunit beta
MTAKIVYYGPGLCGKTTNLMVIFDKLDPKSRGELTSLVTTPDRTLFLPVYLGKVASFYLEIHLYTVPGQAVHDEARRVVLEGADAIVFVCDSQAATVAATRESFASLVENLEKNRIDPNDIPIVIQFNKRDIPGALPVDELRRLLRFEAYPHTEAAAIRGDGVMETFRVIAKITAKHLFARLKADSDSLEKERTSRRELTQITNQIVSAESIPHALMTLKDRILGLFEAERLTIYAIDVTHQELYSLQKTGDVPEEIRVPKSFASIAGYTALARKTINIKDAYDAAELRGFHLNLRFDQRWDKQTGFRTRSVLAVPILFEKYLLGVVQILNKWNGTSFTSMDEDTVEEIARILGIAFYNQHRVARMPSRFKQAATNAHVNDTNVEQVLIEEHNVPLMDSTDEGGVHDVQPIEYDLAIRIPDGRRNSGFVEAKPPASPTPVPAASGETTRLFLMNSLAEDYVSHGEYEKAANILEKLIEYEPQSPQHRNKLQFVRSRMSGCDTIPSRRPPPMLEMDEPGPSLDFDAAESEELSFDMDASGDPSIASSELPAPQPPSFASSPSAFRNPFEITAAARAGNSVDDLDFITEHLTEAEVFAKYGMPEKVSEHLRAVIDRIPQYIQGGDPRQVQELAGRCFELARQQGLEAAPEQAGQDLADRAEASGRENVGRETADCSVFAPDETRPGDSVLVQAFAHRRQAAALVEKLARDFDEDARRRATTILHASIQRGELLTFHLTTTIGIVDPPLQSARWDGEVMSLQFGLAIPSDTLEGNCLGTLIVSRESVPVGHLKFVIKIRNRVDAAAAALTTARRYRKAFVSYATSDRVEVLKRVQMLSQLRVDFFQDILELQPGAKWRDELFHQIDESDLFLLFWSSAARESEWVMNEVRYAIQRQASSNGEPEIMPVIVEGPPPAAPPPELQHLHFDDYLMYFMTAP